MRRHAPVFKKNLLLHSLNIKLSREGALIELQQAAASVTPADIAFEKEMKALLYEHSSKEDWSGDASELLSGFPEASLLTMFGSSLLGEYFSENIQLLYVLESMKSTLIKEWNQSEEV